MAQVVFFEKPGCINNTKQKELLLAAGHEVEARNLLTERWSAERLRRFFFDLPVAGWFNRSAPDVVQGRVVPEYLDAEKALQLMIENPLLIRRPLMEVEGECWVGFDSGAVDAWIGLHNVDNADDLERCPRQQGNACD